MNIKIIVNIFHSGVLQEDTTKATEICANRINTRRTCQDLESEIVNRKKQIQLSKKAYVCSALEQIDKISIV